MIKNNRNMVNLCLPNTKQKPRHDLMAKRVMISYELERGSCCW